jgi:hypothetical protein
VCDISRDITLLLTSFPSSEGSNVRRAIGVSHPRVVVGDTAHPSRMAPFVWNATELFLVSISIAEQTLVDSGTVTHGVPMSFAPLTLLIVLFGAVFPSIRKVVEAGVKHGSWDL